MESVGFRQQTYLTGRTDRVQQLAHVSLVDGAENTLLGLNAGAKNSGHRNTYIGANVATFGSLSSNNVFVGAQAAEFVRRSYDNVAIGRKAAQFMNSATYNVVVGTQAGSRMQRSSYNTVVGYKSGGMMMSGAQNTFVGALSGYYTFNATDNVFAGFAAGMHNRYGHRNTFVGAGAGKNSDTGNDSVFIGFEAGAGMVHADGSTIIGRGAAANAAGSYNTLLGSDVASSLQGNACVAVGYNTASNARSSNSVFIGAFAGRDAHADESVAVGFDALCTAVGSYITCIGTTALCNLTGNSNTVCGSHTWQDARGDYNSVFGSNALNVSVNGNTVTLQNCVVIGEDITLDMGKNPSSNTGQTWWQNDDGTWKPFVLNDSVFIGPKIRLRPDDNNSILLQYGNLATQRIILGAGGTNIVTTVQDLANKINPADVGKDFDASSSQHTVAISSSTTPSGFLQINARNADKSKTGSLLLSFTCGSSVTGGTPMQVYTVFMQKSPSLNILAAEAINGKMIVTTDADVSISYQGCGFQTSGTGLSGEITQVINTAAAASGLWLISVSNTAATKFGVMLLAFYLSQGTYRVQEFLVQTAGPWVYKFRSDVTTAIVIKTDSDIKINKATLLTGSALALTPIVQGSGSGPFYAELDLTGSDADMFVMTRERGAPVYKYGILMLAYNRLMGSVTVVGTHTSPNMTPPRATFLVGGNVRVYIDEGGYSVSWSRVGFPSAA